MYWCTPLFDPPTGSPKLCWLATTAKHANPAPSHDACHLILLKTATKQPILTKALQPTPLAIVELLPQTLILISRSYQSIAPLPRHWHRLSSSMLGLLMSCSRHCKLDYICLMKGGHVFPWKSWKCPGRWKAGWPETIPALDLHVFVWAYSSLLPIELNSCKLQADSIDWYWLPLNFKSSNCKYI